MPLQFSGGLDWRQSQGLASLVPLLGPYLSRRCIVCLTLVDHAVGIEAQRLLWRNIHLGLTIRSVENNPMNLDDPCGTALLNILSTRHELRTLVRSLELTCRLDSTPLSLTPIVSSRSRPPPLRLSPSATSMSRLSTAPLAPPERTLPRTAPLLESHPKVAPTGETDVTCAENAGSHASVGKPRRASLLLRRPSLNLKAGVPDTWRTSVAELRPASVRLSRPLSLVQSCSVETLGPSTSKASAPSQSLVTAADQAGPSVSSFKHLTLPGDSTWTPPPEWGLGAPPDSRCSSHQSLPSPPLHPTGRQPHPQWDAPTRLNPTVPPPRPKSLLLTLRPRPSPTSMSTESPTLKVSPSLPSLRGLHSSTTSRPPSIFDSDANSSLPVTAAPSPTTPYSMISLSAFPLPPLISTPPSVPPFPVQFVHSYSGTNDNTPTPLLAKPPPAPTQRRNFKSGLPETLATALSHMVNLTHVTIILTSSTVPSVSSGLSPVQSLNPSAKDASTEASFYSNHFLRYSACYADSPIPSRHRSTTWTLSRMQT